MSNFSLNKESKSFKEPILDEKGFLDDSRSTKRRLSTLLAEIERGGWDIESLHDELDHLVYGTVLGMQPTLAIRYSEIYGKVDEGRGMETSMISGATTLPTAANRNFHIFGLDVLLTTSLGSSKLKPLLVEVNANPSFSLAGGKEGVSAVDLEVKTKVLKGAFRIAMGRVDEDVEDYREINPGRFANGSATLQVSFSTVDQTLRKEIVTRHLIHIQRITSLFLSLADSFKGGAYAHKLMVKLSLLQRICGRLWVSSQTKISTRVRALSPRTIEVSTGRVPLRKYQYLT